MEKQTTQPQKASTTTFPDASTTPAPVIWTPRFLVIFALTLILGLSVESLLTQGWLNGIYPGQWIPLGHVALIFGGWIALIVFGRSSWVRLGGIFGCIWAIFISINLVTAMVGLDPTSPIVAHLNVAYSCALLGSYICLSIDHTPFETWDIWFFRLALTLGCAIAIVAYFIIPVATRSLSLLESDIAAIVLGISILVWCVRPSSWKIQPGPTFLFGAAPIISLLLSIPNLANGETNYFLSQVALLCLLLGTMRILQAELRTPQG